MQAITSAEINLFNAIMLYQYVHYSDTRWRL